MLSGRFPREINLALYSMQASCVCRVKNTRKRARRKSTDSLPDLDTKQIETLRYATRVFRPFHTREMVGSQSLLPPSVFEMTVSRILMRLYVSSAQDMTLPVREIEISVLMSWCLRKVIDGTYRAGLSLSNPFSRGRELTMRYDFLWYDLKFKCIRIIEVDGEQHVTRNALFDRACGQFEHRSRRDAFKTYLCRLMYPRVVLLRIGPRLRRARARVEVMAQKIASWCAMSPVSCHPVVCIGFESVRGLSAACLGDARTRKMLRDGLFESIQGTRIDPESMHVSKCRRSLSCNA